MERNILKCVRNFLAILITIATTAVIVRTCTINEYNNTEIPKVIILDNGDTIVVEKLMDWGRKNYIKYPELRRFNNPYGISEECTVITYFDEIEALEYAIELIQKGEYYPSEYHKDDIESYFKDTFDFCEETMNSFNKEY